MGTDIFIKGLELCDSCAKVDLVRYLRPKIGPMQINPEDSATLASTRLGTVRDLAGKCNCPLCRLALDTVRLNVSNLPVPSLLDMEVVLCSRYVTLLINEDGQEKEISQMRFDLIEPKRRFRSGSDTSLEQEAELESREEKPWDIDELAPLVQNSQSIVETPFDYCIQLESEEGLNLTQFDSGKSFLAKSLHPEVDIEMIKNWVGGCEEHHEEVCNKASWVGSQQLPSSFRVLDVHKLHVVPAPKACRYAALSYVWGSTSMPRPTALGHEDETRDYSSVFKSLPQTIQDAILFTRAIGESYLWVDAMCIFQDRETDKVEQIGHMDVIYGLARFTIVAAAGNDADAGLPGVRPGTRSVHQLEAKIHNLQLRSSLAAGAAVDHSLWNQRAWTLQERLLSKRCVIFTEHQVYFQCKSRNWSEDTHIHEPGDIAMKIVQPYRTFESLQSPIARNNFQTLTQDSASTYQTSLRGSSYEALVTEFTSRRLTYGSDALNAFRGVEKLLSKRVTSPCILGLPMALFDEALLWQPVLRDVRSFTPRPMFPSWSWASWDGGVAYTHNKNTRALIWWLETSDKGELLSWRSAWLKRGGHPGWGNDAEALRKLTSSLVSGFHDHVPRVAPGERICLQSARDVAPGAPLLREIAGCTTTANLRVVPRGSPPGIDPERGWVLCDIFHGQEQLTRWTDRTVLLGDIEPATISLPKAWVGTDGEKLCEFILIALECSSLKQDAHIMLVERHGRSMRRVGLTKVSHLQWAKCRPEPTLAIII